MFQDKGPYDMEEVMRVAVEQRGNLTAMARELGRSRPKLVAYVNKTPEVLALLEDIREQVVDQAEQNIYAAVDAGDLAASKFVLQTLGRDRGYVERKQVEGSLDLNFDPKAELERKLASIAERLGSPDVSE